MKNGNQQQLDLIQLQYIINTILLGGIAFSFLFSYNLQLKLTGKQAFWDDETVHNLSIILRVLLLIGASMSIYENFQNIEFLKEANADTQTIESAQMEAWASSLAWVVALLVLMAAINDPVTNQSNIIENSEL